MVDVTAVATYAASASALIALLATLWTFVTAGTRRNEAVIRSIADRQAATDLRLQSLEQTVNTLPGKDVIHSLSIELLKISANLQAMQVALDGTRQIMERLEATVARHDAHIMALRPTHRSGGATFTGAPGGAAST